jgi:hypothetical protein
MGYLRSKKCAATEIPAKRAIATDGGAMMSRRG